MLIFSPQILQYYFYTKKILDVFQFLISNRGRSLATLRERVERQRSVTSSAHTCSESSSIEGLNLERGEPVQKSRTNQIQLDNQVSSLHQDVAALSVEVNLNLC